MIDQMKNLWWVGTVVLALIGGIWSWVVQPALAEETALQIDQKVNSRIEDLEGNQGRLRLKANDTNIKIIELQAEQRVINVKIDQVLDLLKRRIEAEPADTQ